MKAFLISVLFCPIGLADTLPEVISGDTVLSYVSGKLEVTTSVLEKLENERIKTSYFWVLRDTTARLARARIARYENFFKLAGDSFGVNPGVLKSICFVESYGRPDVKSYAGACGLMQFMPSTARSYGLKIVYQTKQVKKNGKLVNQKVLVRDDRTDPEKSIFAAARMFKSLEKDFGLDLSVCGYHMGPGNLNKIQMLALNEFSDDQGILFEDSLCSDDLSWSQIYFCAKKDGALYCKMVSLKDNSMNYYFSVRAAWDLLQLDSLAYLSYYMSARNLANPDKKAPHRFYAWYSPDDAPYKTKSDIEKAVKNGELVYFPVAKPIIDGPQKIELEKKELVALPETVGAALLLDRLLKIRNPKEYEKLKVVSMTDTLSVVRTDSLVSDSIPKDRVLPISSFGVSFVIEAPQNLGARQAFEYLLKQLSDFSYLSYAKADSGYLVVIPPDERIRRIYRAAWLELGNG